MTGNVETCEIIENVIRLSVIALLWIPAFILAMRYNLHMFQLNGYKNNEQFTWLKKNLRKQWILIWDFALGLTRCFYRPLWLDIIIALSLIMTILVFRAHKILNTKKKLVYTARVKRLIVTDIILCDLVVMPLSLFVDGWLSSGLLICVLGDQFFFNILANLVNRPMEKSVGNWYINDAKKKLQSVDGIKIIGITGSYGKTSVKFYLQTLLQTKYNTLVTPESYNTPMGVVRTIREHLKPTHEIFVCEMGARYVGDIKELCDIVHPQMGVITSVGPQHLETFGDIEHVKDTKFELADALPKGGLIFLNGDNEYIQQKASQYEDVVFYYSDEGVVSERIQTEDESKEAEYKKATADPARTKGYRAHMKSVSQLGTEFSMTTPEGETEDFAMRLIGAHNIINVAGAIAVAHKLGISLKELKIPVRRIQPVEHRMQLREHGEVTIIDDAYNSNPVGSKAAVETLKLFDGVRILITPGMVELGDKEEEYNYKFGTYAADCCDYILLVGKNHTEPIRKGVLEAGFDEKKCHSYDHLEEALSYAYSIKAEGHKYILLENDLPDNY